jgi:aminobenzoyl-glutamate transport protein
VRSRGVVNRFLDVVERVGNALPDPTTLFALLAPGIVLLCGLASQFDLTVTHLTTGKLIKPVSLLSVDGCTASSPGSSPTSPASRRSARCSSP